MQYKEIIQKGQQRISSFQGIKRDAWDIVPLWKLKKIITLIGG
jgi:hypothetical protein